MGAKASLLGWLDEPDSNCGIDFAGPGDEWSFVPYTALATQAMRVGEGLRQHGVGEGDRVAVALRSGPEFVATLFGAIRVGASVTPISPPAALGDIHGYLDHVHAILRRTEPSVLVTRQEHRDLLLEGVGSLKVSAQTPENLLAHEPIQAMQGPAQQDAIALIQYTSGSTGRSRGIPLTVEAVESNLAMIASWLRMRPGDITASWLPIHHDMGLIGCLLTPVVHQTGIRLLTPEHFIRSPGRYLRCFGEQGCKLSAMPTFGLRHIATRVKEAELESCDFSAWRALIVGAERIDPQVLRAFTELLAPHGFSSRALLPAYGLAEATLAVTGVALEDDWSSAIIDPASLAPGETLTIDEEGVELPSSGPALPSCSVTIVDEDGRPLPEMTIGEIHVTGPSVGSRYLGHLTADGQEQSSGPSAFTGDGGVRTGDAGFLLDGHLHVLGRMGDALKVRGRTVFAEDVELAVASQGLHPSKVVALLGEAQGIPTVVVAVETPPEGWETTVQGEVIRLAPDASFCPVALPRGAITRTTSGKPRRRILWQAFVNGDLSHPSAN